MTLPRDYSIRLMRPTDYATISEICRVVYPHDTPYTAEELAEHHAVYPQGQFVAEYTPTCQTVIRRAKTGHASAPKTGHRVGGIGRKNPLVRTCWQGV